VLNQLCDHQDKILAHIAQKEALIRSLAAPDAMVLGKARWELTRLLSAYQIFKHSQIFDPVIARGAPEAARRAQRLKIDCIAMGDAFRAYVAHWMAVGITDHWEAYKPAALACIATTRQHLATERREVEALVRLLETREAERRRA
jgi:hypothetical protein